MSAAILEGRNRQIVEALEGGETKVQVAQRFGLSERAVYGIGKQAGWQGHGGGKRVKGEGPPDSEQRARAWTDAERAYLLQFVAELPDPARYARTLPAHVVEALMSAHWSKRDTCWWVEPDKAKLLIPYGLCEVGKHLVRHAIGSFGRQVMREIRKDG